MRCHHVIRLGCIVLALQACSSVRADEETDADERQLKAGGVGVDGPALLHFFRDRTLTEADNRRLKLLVQQLGNSSYAKRRQASLDLIARGRLAISFLQPALSDRDPEVSQRAEQCLLEIRRASDPGVVMAAARHLARHGPDGAVKALLDFLPYAEDEGIEEEVLTALAAKGLCDDRAVPVLKQALNDPASLRRGAAAFALGRMSDKDLQAAAVKLLDDGDARVRLRAAQGLLAGGNRRALPALIQLVGAEGGDAGWQAEQILYQIAGERPPPLPVGGSPEIRKKRQDAWHAWSLGDGATVDLTKIPREPPLLGFTLIAHVDSNKVWECGRDGKVRATISGLNGPIEVRPLPGNRVLITETHGRRITERDWDGKIYWEAKARDAALSAQRLRGGNTFIATNGSMSEVGRDGKEVYCHTYAGLNLGPGRFESGCKTRDGRILATAGDRLVQIEAATGKIVKTTKLLYSGCYSVEDLRGGRVLLVSYNSGKVMEVDADDGTVLWTYDLPNAFQATRLPNGNTLMTSHSGKKVLEVSPDKKIVWEQGTDSLVWRAYRR